MNIQELITSYNSLVKEAFIPNPEQQGQEGQEGQLEQAYQQLSQLLSGMPPEVQGQIEPMLQQLQQLPPADQLSQISGLIQQLSQGGAQQEQPQEQAQPQEEQSGMVPEGGHVNAENSLDNTKVTLSVRELLDLSSGGKATQSLLKVKQMAETHNKKMEAVQQQAEQEQVTQQQQQQQQEAMGQGGIYSQPMNAKPGQPAPTPAM